MLDINLLDNVTDKPGIYLWKNASGQIIYVGKAKNLQARMKQYFRGMQNSYKTQKMVEMIASFEYIITTSDQEALILERNLIEKHFPPFNILLLDDKRYPYIKVELKQRLEVMMVYRVRSERTKALYLGPFPTGYGARNILNLITRLVLYDKGLPIADAPYEVWKLKYDYIHQIFSGSIKNLIKELQLKMQQASENELYEIALDLKNSIEALNFYSQKQVVELNDHRQIDVIAFTQHERDYLAIGMLFYRQGMLLSKKDMVIDIVGSYEETISHFVHQYYYVNIEPDLIVTNASFEFKKPILNPQKGKFSKLLELAMQNANDNLGLKIQSFLQTKKITIDALSELGAKIGLQNLKKIIMFDNSTTNNSNPVSVVVSYRNGLKVPNEYRKFDVDKVEVRSDLAYLEEGARKYFANEHPRPDLIIVDGGRLQVNVVKKFVRDIPIIGLIKNEDHHTEKIFGLNMEEIPLDKKSNLYHFLANMQIEVDRYAKSYHSKRFITTLEGKLINIPGIGPSAEKRLLKHFQTYAAIYNASVEELGKVVSTKQALAIKENLKEL